VSGGLKKGVWEDIEKKTTLFFLQERGLFKNGPKKKKRKEVKGENYL